MAQRKTRMKEEQKKINIENKENVQKKKVKNKRKKE